MNIFLSAHAYFGKVGVEGEPFRIVGTLCLSTSPLPRTTPLYLSVSHPQNLVELQESANIIQEAAACQRRARVAACEARSRCST